MERVHRANDGYTYISGEFESMLESGGFFDYDDLT
jgi:hypothetical protein